MTDKLSLKLTLHRDYFEAIAAGRKVEEYRKIKPYWTTRLVGRNYDEINFRNGYNPDSPFMRVEYLGYEIDHEQGLYVLKLGSVLEIQHWEVK
jgi:hypothetical protein